MSAFIFDVDGTLAETEEAHREAFNAAFEAEGLEWTWDFDLYKRLLTVSGGKERLLHFIESGGIAVPGNAGAVVARLHAAKTELYAGLVADGRLPLKPGIIAVIERAEAEGVRLAIATTTTRGNVDALLGAAGVATDRFDAIICGDMVPLKKPAPDVYLRVLADLDLPAAACLAFEDSWNGLSAAKGAGLRCVVTPALYTADEDFAAADLVLPDLRDADRVFALLKETV